MYHEDLKGRPSYRHEYKDLYLFFANNWKVGAHDVYGHASSAVTGYIFAKKYNICPIDVGKNWRLGVATNKIDHRILVLSTQDPEYKLKDIGNFKGCQDITYI